MKRECIVFAAAVLLFAGAFTTYAYCAPMTEEEMVEIRQAMELEGVQDIEFDFNVRVHVPKTENPYIPADEEDADLWATVIRPKKSSDEKLPTILAASGYTRLVAMLAAMVIPHGYNFVALDLRGTGSSGGTWPVLSFAEQYDVKYVIDDWIPSHNWSDGKIGYMGMSYLAIIGSLAAGLVDRNPITGEPDHLKAMFILSMMSDAYQGAGGMGGNVNIALLSTWIGATSILAAMPPFLFLGEDEFRPDKDDLREAVDIWMTHIMQIQDKMGLLMDYNNSFDGEFWDRKSAMIYWPVKPAGGWGFDEGDKNVIPSKLPIFTGTGWFDMFTRGVCNYYQYGLSQHDSEDKAMIIGEWGHAGACSGLGLTSMETFKLQFRWFDWKIKNNGRGDCFMKDFPVLIRVMGVNRWRAEKSWPLPESRVEDVTFYLSKAGAEPINNDWYTNSTENQIYSLVENISEQDFSGENPVLKHSANDLHGMTSRSTQRWLYGGLMLFTNAVKYLMGVDIDDSPVAFWEDERSDERKILTFTTKPLEEDLEIVGPLLLKFWAKTEFTHENRQDMTDQTIDLIKSALGMDANLLLDVMNERTVQWVAELNDVYPDGRARNITSGWLNASHRQYDPDEPVVAVDHAIDPNYTPFDPFYDHPDKDPKLINEGELYQYAIELWPTCNVFKSGNRVRITLSGSDFPHLLPVITPSLNTIVIDDDHLAMVEFKTTNSDNEGDTYKWIGPSGYKPDSTVSNYLIEDTDTPDSEENAGPAAFGYEADNCKKIDNAPNVLSSSRGDKDSGCFLTTAVYQSE